MKKRIIMCIIASAMICGSIASCGKSVGTDRLRPQKRPQRKQLPRAQRMKLQQLLLKKVQQTVLFPRSLSQRQQMSSIILTLSTI